MSDAVIMHVPLTSVAARRSEFRPMRALAATNAAVSVEPDEYARGLIDGQQIAEAAFAVEKNALIALLGNTQSLKPEAGPELSTLLRETVVRLVEQICDGITIDADLLETQIGRAVAIITEADEARQIILHPDDAAIIGDNIHSLAVRSDPDLARGSIRIECSQGWIEHGVALGIERLRDLLNGAT